MRVILPGNELIKNIIRKSNFSADDVFTPSKFTVFSEDEHSLAHNTLTKSLVQLDVEEINLFKNTAIKFDESIIPFIESGFLVKYGTDEVKTFEQVKSVLNFFKKKEKGITTYTILTTTDCNARCFYCYEAGIKKDNMTEETARKIVEYIKNNCCGHDVTLSWFGGEPLFNSKVIDIICEGLKKNNIKYVSKMTSNGYLFDDALVKKSKDLWKLVKVQITLDGTEDVYNTCKNYIYDDGKSPFKVVCDNIQRLIDNKIYVNVRMNMDEHNKDDLYNLIEYINKRYPNKDHLSAYVMMLFDHDATQRTIEEKLALAKVKNELSSLLVKYGFDKSFIKQKLDIGHCLADSDSTVIINPSGGLGCCEHYVYEETFGSIYEPEKVDEDVILSWKEFRAKLAGCDACALLPACIWLKKCPEAARDCDEADRIIYFNNVRRRMVSEYKRFNKNN